MDRTRRTNQIDLPMYTAYSDGEFKPSQITETIDKTKNEVVTGYSLEQLEGFLQEVVPEKELPLEYKEYFKERIKSWKEPDEPTK